MGRIRVAKDGHLYERRRTYGGRFYTVQHGRTVSFNPNPGCTDKQVGEITILVGILLLLGLFFAPMVVGSTLLTGTVIGITLFCQRRRPK